MVDVMVTGGRIPPDIQYYFDGALECFDIPPDVYLWGKYFCPNSTELLDNMERDDRLQVPGHHGSTLTNYGKQFELHYLEWQKTAQPEAVALCLAFGVTYMGSTKAIISEICNTLVEDEYGVLAGVSYYVQNTRFKKNGLVFYDGVKMFERKKHFLDARYRIREQWEALEHPDYSQLRLTWPQLPGADTIREYLYYDEEEGFTTKKPAPDKKTKRALKRSAKLLDSVTGENTVQMFLSGEEVSVVGQKYRFSLTKEKYGTLNSSHGSATTKVYDKETNEFICGLCIYTQNVTVFDHLASIVLHCKSGLEDLIIEEANITQRGKIDLLPQSKLDQIDGKNQLTDHATEIININGIESELTIVESDPLARSIRGPHYKLIDQRKHLVDAANKKAKEKLVQRIQRKYPHLFIQPKLLTPQIRQLFSGPRAII